MMPYSLRRRLLAWLVLATAVVGVLALIDTWREALRTAQSVSDRVLAGSALAIAERVSVDETGGLEVDIPYSSLEMLASTAQDRVFYRVDAPVETFLTGYENLAIVPIPSGQTIGFADGTYDTIRVRSATLTRSLSTGARPIDFTVTVAESTLAREALARTILLRSALRLGILILSVISIVWIAVTLALRPLDRLVEAIARRSPDDLHPLQQQSVKEVNVLAEAMNSFMQRLDTALAALKHFTGNASHQLRTPLAVLRAQLALAARSTNPDEAEAATAKAETALLRAERVLAQLLVLAHVDAVSGATPLQPVNIVAIAKTLTSELVPQALENAIDLGYEGPDAALAMAEPVLLAELLKNLLDNAIAYAGRGAIVTVKIHETIDNVVLSVEDNGPGLPTDNAIKAGALKRGAPKLPRKAVAETGYGLGLAITTEIAALFGATLRLEPVQNGRGLAASVTLLHPRDRMHFTP
jgi:two-component system, OmpR family, sensor histidine kinase TctE